jgi:beta-barrel assembly-enhancing protease
VIGRSIRAALMFGLASLGMPTAPAFAQFSDIGGIINAAKGAKKLGDSFRTISDAEEVKMGGDLAGIVLGAAPLANDPSRQHYVNRLGQWLAMHSERPNLPWKFGIIDTGDFNAFSTPGGYVLISRGLLDDMRTESELAGVLSHEIAHVVRKHHLKALQTSLRDSAVGDFKDYVGGPGGIAGQFASALVTAGKDMFVRGLDRGDEYEADRMAVVIAARAGYSPYGLGGVLQTLSAEPEAKGFALMYKTHPLPVDRLERLDIAMGTRLDGYQGLVDDLPSFVALQAPPPLPSASAPAKKDKRRQ